MSNTSAPGALAEAQAWAESWLGMQCIAEAAETRCSPGRSCNARDPDRDRPLGRMRHAGRASERISRFFQHAFGCAKLQPCASRPAELGPALRRSLARRSRDPGQPNLCARETCRQRRQRSRDSRLGLDQLRRRSGRSQGQPTTHTPADLDRNRKGAPSPPRSNGQVFDEARNPVTVAGRRRCRASGPAHPCWDPAYPSGFRPMDWLVAPRLARKAQARQSPRRCSRDALFSFCSLR
jgi:hypothetical protein